MSSDVKKRMAIGAGWMVGLRVLDKLVGFVSIGILARLLLPEDFGLVAYGTTVYGILQSFCRSPPIVCLVHDRINTEGWTHARG